MFFFRIYFLSSSTFSLNTRLTKSGLFWTSSLGSRCSYISGQKGLQVIVKNMSDFLNCCTNVITFIYPRRMCLVPPMKLAVRIHPFLIFEVYLSRYLSISIIPCSTLILNRFWLSKKKSNRCVSSLCIGQLYIIGTPFQDVKLHLVSSTLFEVYNNNICDKKQYAFFYYPLKELQIPYQVALQLKSCSLHLVLCIFTVSLIIENVKCLYHFFYTGVPSIFTLRE